MLILGNFNSYNRVLLETQNRRPVDSWVSSAEFFENALCGAAVIKSLTKCYIVVYIHLGGSA